MMLARGGAVVIADRDASGADATAASLASAGANVLPVSVGDANEHSVTHLSDLTNDRLGGVDVIVNNAGIYPKNLLTEVPTDAWHTLCSP